MFCFDITEKSSFEKVQDFWIEELSEHAPPTAIKMLVGLKSDLISIREVPMQKA